jgi:two-component system sensor histidine kinase CpxA
MRSLFLKIFLSFWLAQALSVALAVVLTLALRPPAETATWGALRENTLNGAVEAYEQGGSDAARSYLEDVERNHELRAFLFDEQGNEVTGRPVPHWAEFLLQGRKFEPPGFVIHEPQRFWLLTKIAASGRRYSLSAEMPHGPRALFGPHGVPGLGIALGIISSGLVCYFLARYLTNPLRRLRAATQQLAAGDLAARADDPPRRRRDEIAELVRDFNGMAGRLQDLMSAQNHLLHDISHELRSPLARLSVALGLARQRTGPEAESVLDRIETETRRLNELIGRLLTLARLEGGEEAIAQRTIRLGELIQEIGRDAEFEAQSRGCHVRANIVSDCELNGNLPLLRSAIENVVRNAIRYTRENSEVEIRLDCEPAAAGREAVIRVSDSGPGVPEETLDKLFLPFYRLENDRGRQSGGVGLGLSITDRAVRLHGGSARASNRPAGGLVVELRLPAGARQLSAELGSPVPV